MAYYRLYLMDGRSGHVESVIELEASDDDEAVRNAESHRCQVAMELWCSRRKVKHWPPNFATPERES